MSAEFDKVIDKIREVNFWDDVYFDIADDNYGESYVIFDGWDDHNKFTNFVKETLELDDEIADYEIEKILETNFVFSDEYTTCSDCNSVIRTSPDSYGWQPDFYVGDGFIACNKCFNETEDYQEAYIEEKINSPKNAINGLISESQLEELGFTQINEDSYESGLHHGQTDNPEAIYNELKDSYEEIVFFIDSVGQFDIHFSVWGRGEIE